MYQIVGAAMEVHKVLGRGLAEAIYQEALTIELSQQSMIVEREKILPIYYKGQKMQKTYLVDVYYKGIIIELKSTNSLCSEHRAQLFNYMRISKTYRGLLIKFGEKSLHAERYLYLPEQDHFILLTQENYKEYITDK